MSSRSSVDRAPARRSGGHGFDSCRGLRIFLCPTLVSCWSVHFSHFITELKINHFYSLMFILSSRAALFSFFSCSVVSRCTPTNRTPGRVEKWPLRTQHKAFQGKKEEELGLIYRVTRVFVSITIAQAAQLFSIPELFCPEKSVGTYSSVCVEVCHFGVGKKKNNFVKRNLLTLEPDLAWSQKRAPQWVFLKKSKTQQLPPKKRRSQD